MDQDRQVAEAHKWQLPSSSLLLISSRPGAGWGRGGPMVGGLALLISSHHYPVFWLWLKDLSLARNGSTSNRKRNFCSKQGKEKKEGRALAFPRSPKQARPSGRYCMSSCKSSQGLEEGGCEEGGWRGRSVGVGRTAWWAITPPGMGHAVPCTSCEGPNSMAAACWTHWWAQSRGSEERQPR